MSFEMQLMSKISDWHLSMSYWNANHWKCWNNFPMKAMEFNLVKLENAAGDIIVINFWVHEIFSTGVYTERS